MRAFFRLGAFGCVALALGASPAFADFNPLGRHAGKHPSARGASHAPGHGAAGHGPSAASSPSGAAGQNPGATENGESTEVLIARYTALVLARPGEPFPLERLVELYRERDGNLDKLIAELSSRSDKTGTERYAALVALGGTLAHDAQSDKAVAAYERAIAEAPKNPVGVLALGRLLESRGDKAGARRRYEEALPDVQGDADREQLLHTLLGLCLSLDDYAAAEKYHDGIVTRAKGSFLAREELGRDLFDRGEFERAEAEYRKVVKWALGDNRALAPAERDLGRTLARENKTQESLDVLRKALTAAGGQSGLRREILDTMADVYRAKGGVAELVKLLEAEHPDDFERLTLLGGLYEETGRVEDALAAYQRALARKDDIATRLKVVQLFEIEGKLDQASHEYELLIRASPNDPDFVFRFAETLIQRGDRARALAELGRLEARTAGDDETASALVDFYERINEPDRATRLLDRLANTRGSDPRYLVDLGDQYYRKGDTKRAREIWERIRVMVPDRAKGLHSLGEVLLEHDLSDEALLALKQASELAPHELKYQKALALALERTGTSASGVARSDQYDAATRLWQNLLHEAPDPAGAREARQHIVTIWSLEGSLSDHARPLERRLAQAPPDLEAGRLLAEVYGRLRRPSDAERVLRVIVTKDPGDEEAYLSLERALVAQHELAAAITVLARLVNVDARRAREYYERMAQYSAELYRDDDAIRYASKAVELSPDDAEGHRKLGEMYRRRQDVDHAIVELRLALAKNDRQFPVYFDLADLLVTRGEVDEADRLLRRVVRACPDDELVARAARLSMQLNLGRGTLESLERELLPVALGNPGRPIYRRLLVEVYGNLAFPLEHEANASDPARATAARAALHELGERAVKPLLDALSDDRDSQQRIAVDLLSYISNASAGPALITFAMGKAEGELRTRAMLAVGELRDPALLPRIAAIIAPAGNVRVDETDTVAVAAAWSVARMQSPKARPLLVEMLSSDAPSVRALGAIGLGLLANHADARALVALADSSDQEIVVRAAAAYALGALGASPAADAVLTRLAESTDPVLCGTAVLALARTRSPSAKTAVANALVGPDVELRAAASDAALVLATRDYRAPADVLPMPEGRIEVRTVLEELRPTGFTADDRARAVANLEKELVDAAVTAVRSGPEGASVVADALLGRNGKPTFAPLTDDLDTASPDARAAADATLERVAAALVEPFLLLTHHPSADVRAHAIRVLSYRPEDAARAAVVAALDDKDASVQRAALASLSRTRDDRALDAVIKLSETAGDWPMRERATRALGALVNGPRADAAIAALATVAGRDPIAFVRESAVRALRGAPGDKASRSLESVARADPEPRVRELAKSLLSRSP